MDYALHFMQMQEAILALSAVTVVAAISTAIFVRSSFPFALVTIAALCYLLSSSLIVAATKLSYYDYEGIIGRAIGFDFFEAIFPALAWCVAFGALRAKRLETDHSRWHFWKGHGHGIHLAYFWTFLIIIIAIAYTGSENSSSSDVNSIIGMSQFCAYALWAYPVFFGLQWHFARNYELPDHSLFFGSLGAYSFLMLLVTIGKTVYVAQRNYTVNFAMSELFGIFALWVAIAAGRFWTHKAHESAATSGAPAAGTSSAAQAEPKTQV
ncbi:hypothetical protein BCR43DRAFT_494104 [Syncephalastrum racemosum]|uniref:Uncharacterized protein n=1 Tax=Syncephalastrum racemosum TaxID=13706 RepID=A0A1X2H7G3_SYNRA|nr:hypothetical protein BCR43DRAFT_494104 [Syncephalastrum racemosum]